MQNTPNVESTEIKFSTNRQRSVFSLYNFTRINRQIVYILVALKIKKNVCNIKKNVNRHVFNEEIFKM